MKIVNSFYNKMKRYNYKTKKIYESVSVFSLSLDEFDANGKLTDSKDFEDTYSTLEDAIEDAYNIMTNVAKNDNIDEDDVAYDENGNTVVFTVDGVGKWVFTVNSSQDDNVSECGTSESNTENNDTSDSVNEDKKEDANESVAERFARLRKMFESEGVTEDEDEDKDNGEEGSEEDSEAKEAGEKEDDSENDTKDEDNKDEEDQDEDMKAVIISVKKGDEDKCKDELIDAGISEDDIEILDADEDAENIDIRIDVNAVMELKDYLAKKGIDLEEEIGGEIVSDDEESEDSEDKENDEENAEGEGDEDFDFDNLGDIFGAEDEE